MVYVFGLNVPLVELLLLFFILLTASLGFILFELKKLRQLLTEERGVIRQFEDDLSRFEKDAGKVHNTQVEAYVKSALGRGVSKDQIRQTLIQRGWDGKTVDKLLSNS